MQVHHRLLFLHGVFLLGIFLVDGLHLGLQHAGDGRRFVGLECQGEQQGLDDDGQDEDDDAVVPSILAQPVEHGDDTIVDPTDEEEVTQVDLVLQTELVTAQGLEVVRTEIERHRHHVDFSVFVVRDADVGRHRLVITRVIRLAGVDRHLGVVEAFLGHDDIAEETLLERDPFQFRIDILLHVLVHLEVVDILIVKGTVVDRLVGETVGALLLLHHVDGPVEAHIVGIGGDDIFHPDSADIEVHHVVVVMDGVDVFDVLFRVVGGQAHGKDQAVAFGHVQRLARIGLTIDIRLEIELRCVDDTILGKKRQVKLDGSRVEHDQGQRVAIGFVVFELHVLKESALVGEGQPLDFVLDDPGLLLPLRGADEDAVFVAQGSGLLLRQSGRIHISHGDAVGNLCQCSGLLAFRVFYGVDAHLFDTGLTDAVLDVHLFLAFLLRGTHEIHPAEEDGCDEKKTKKGVFIVH